MDSLKEEINHIIRTRRSVFPVAYNGQNIPDELILTILENANYAPTHKLTEPWRFQVFKGDGLSKLASFFMERYKSITAPEIFSQEKYESAGDKVNKSGCVIVINMEVHPDKIPEWEEIAAVACAVQNMWLTASANGIGAYWSSPDVLNELGVFLNLPPNQKCMGLFYMGHHNEAPSTGRRKPISDKVIWVR